MKKFFSFALACAVLAAPLSASAHPGRTDKNGGHTCKTNCTSWGLEYGQYHYHNGGSSSSSSGSSSGGGSYSSGNPFILPEEVEHDSYNVFQNDRLLQVVDGYDNALAYAKQWTHAIIQDADTYDILWDNIYSQVFQYGKYVSDFGSRKGAIDWAQGHENSYVVDAQTKAILWHNYPFVVYQGDTYLDWFRNEGDAINYAKQWANSKVVDGLTYKVVWNR